MSHKFSVVLPALNEGNNISNIINTIKKSVFPETDFEIIVVDNGSIDNTGKLAKEAGAKVTCEPNRGYGNALRSGFLSADGEIILMMDADMTYPSDRILDFINYVSSGNYDFVVGNRYRANNRPSFGLLRLYGGKTLSFLGNTLFGTNIKDWHCGMRAFKRQDILDFRLKSENMELASEIILGFIKNKSRILQIDISYNKRVGSSKLSIIKDGLRHLYLIVSHFVKN